MPGQNLDASKIEPCENSSNEESGMSLPGSAENSDSAKPLLNKLSASKSEFIESGLVFISAFLLFALQVFLLMPKLSLLFDSQGYLWIAQSCLNALNQQSLNELASYLFSGCRNEIARAAFVSQNPGLLELCKSGPVLPAILALASGLAQKPLSPLSWKLCTCAMLIISALNITLIHAFARLIGGRFCGAIAALLALSYAGFAVNSGRVLTEIPALTLASAALFSGIVFVRKVENRQRLFGAQAAREDLSKEDKVSLYRNWRAKSAALIFYAILPGFFTGALMLARPTFLVWPILLACSLCVYVSLSKNRIVLSLPAVLAFVLGMAACLAPWALCKQVLTGSPSVTIERYGPYNLSVGLSLANDGYDTLPSPLVNQPHLFKQSSTEVIGELFEEAKQRPLSFIHLLLRKPARLLDSPWNDFQNQVFGLPYLAQRFEHQLILLAAVLGVVLLLEQGRKRPDYFLLLCGLMLGSFLIFHMISVLFISMSRYFFTAMPAAIVAAAYFFSNLTRELGRSGRGLSSAAAISAAVIFSTLLAYLLQAGYARLSSFNIDLGLTQLSTALAFCSGIFLSAAFLVPAFTYFKGSRSRILLTLTSLLCLIGSFVNSSYHLLASEGRFSLGSLDKEKLACRAVLPTGLGIRRWYLLIDANDPGMKENSARSLFENIELSCNERPLKADFMPLLSFDSSQRSEYMYLTSFAYSAGKKCNDLRQWFLAPLPPESINSPGENKIVLKLAEAAGQKPGIFADYTNQMGKRIHTVSTRKFSWSKGFFADNPGEMRMDVWSCQGDGAQDLLNLSGPGSKLKARIYLLGVKAGKNQEFAQYTIKLSDQVINAGKKEMSEIKLNELDAMIKNSASEAAAFRIRVSGKLRSDQDNNSASICLLEDFQDASCSYSEYAPLAPQYLPAGKSWQPFVIDELVAPVRTSSGNTGIEKKGVLKGLRLEFFGKPWWEALGYGIFKGKGRLEFSDLKVEMHTQAGLDLSKDDWQCIELDCDFEKEH